MGRSILQTSSTKHTKRVCLVEEIPTKMKLSVPSGLSLKKKRARPNRSVFLWAFSVWWCNENTKEESSLQEHEEYLRRKESGAAYRCLASWRPWFLSVPFQLAKRETKSQEGGVHSIPKK